jgi:hypothetical protein
MVLEEDNFSASEISRRAAITTRQLQYTDCFGAGDSKAYSEVEIFYDNVHVEKKECVGQCPMDTHKSELEQLSRN